MNPDESSKPVPEHDPAIDPEIEAGMEEIAGPDGTEVAAEGAEAEGAEAEGEADGPRGERIAKWLARAGIASRRDAEKLIAEGRVSLNNNRVTTPATFVGPDDVVLFNGRQVGAPQRTRLFRYHKPAGLVTTHKDPEGRRTVFEELPEGLPRLVSVGRLDLNSEGLLLLTNDGALSRKLELPGNAWLRRYRARVHGEVNEAALAALANGITIEGVVYGGIEAGLDSRQGTNAWLSVALREGKNREVRRVLQHLGLTVTRLIRTAYGPFQLGTLPRGAVEEVNAKVLRDQLGLDAPPRVRKGVDLAAEASGGKAAGGRGAGGRGAGAHEPGGYQPERHPPSGQEPGAPKPDAITRSRPAKAPAVKVAAPKVPRARNAGDPLRRPWGALAHGKDVDAENRTDAIPAPRGRKPSRRQH